MRYFRIPSEFKTDLRLFSSTFIVSGGGGYDSEHSTQIVLQCGASQFNVAVTSNYCMLEVDDLLQVR